MKPIKHKNRGVHPLNLAAYLASQLNHFDAIKNQYIDLSPIMAMTGVGSLYDIHLTIRTQYEANKGLGS